VSALFFWADTPGIPPLFNTSPYRRVATNWNNVQTRMEVWM